MPGSNPPTAPRLLGEPTVLEHLDRSLTIAEKQELLASEAAQELMQTVGGLEKTFSDIAFVQLCEQHKITPLPTPPVLPSHAFQLPDFFCGWADKRAPLEDGDFYVVDGNEYQGIVIYKNRNMFFIQGFTTLFSLVDPNAITAVFAKASSDYFATCGKKLRHVSGSGKFLQKLVTMTLKGLAFEPIPHEGSRGAIIEDTREGVEATGIIDPEKALANQWSDIVSSPLRFAVATAESDYFKLVESLDVVALTAEGLSIYSPRNLTNLRKMFQKDIGERIFGVEVESIHQQMLEVEGKEREAVMKKLLLEQTNKMSNADRVAALIFVPKVIGVLEVVDGIPKAEVNEPPGNKDLHTAHTLDLISTWLSIQKATIALKQQHSSSHKDDSTTKKVEELALSIFKTLPPPTLLVIQTKLARVKNAYRTAKDSGKIARGLWQILNSQMAPLMKAISPR